MHYQLVLLPYPVTPLAVLGLYLHKVLRRFGEQTVFCHCFHPSAKSRQSLQDDCVLRLFGPDLIPALAGLIKQMPTERRQSLRACLLYFSRSPHKYTGELRQMAYAFSNPSLSASSVMSLACELCGKLVERHWRPDNGSMGLEQLLPVSPVSQSAKVCSPPASMTHHTLPVFRSNFPLDHEVVSYRKVVLQESRVAELCGQHLGLVVGGPPQSGKSTLVASLSNELTNLIASLQSRPGWAEFSFSVKCLNLDLGTPTVRAITESAGRDEERLKYSKRPWSKELALKAMRRFAGEKGKVNLVIGDLPGKIDLFTELICASADAGIIVTHDWTKKAEWQAFYNHMGITKVVQAKTRASEEGLTSMVKRFNAGHELAGRIVGLKRNVCSWDPFITFLARALLFDILPSLLERRRQSLNRFQPTP